MPPRRQSRTMMLSSWMILLLSKCLLASWCINMGYTLLSKFIGRLIFAFNCDIASISWVPLTQQLVGRLPWWMPMYTGGNHTSPHKIHFGVPSIHLEREVNVSYAWSCEWVQGLFANTSIFCGKTNKDWREKFKKNSFFFVLYITHSAYYIHITKATKKKEEKNNHITLTKDFLTDLLILGLQLQANLS